MLRLLGWLFGFGVFCLLGAVAAGAIYLNQLNADLPDYTVLKDYQPPVTTRVHAADGTLLAEYARERRLFQPIETIPALVINAFISAEDKDFYSHNGLAVDGIIRALRDNVMARIDGNNAIQGGGSTITQQVAKNFLLTSEQTWDRKIQEAILALRIEFDLLQGQDPRALPQRDLPRAQLLRRRRCRAQLFRQGALRADAERGRLSRGAAQGPEQLSPVPPRQAGRRAPQLGSRSHGREPLPHGRRGRRGQERAAERQAAHLRQPALFGRVLHRGSAPPARQALWRGRALWRRPLGAHHARPPAAGICPQGPDGRAHRLRPQLRLPRPGRDGRHLGRLGRGGERRQAAERRAGVDPRRGARDRRQRSDDRAAAGQ